MFDITQLVGIPQLGVLSSLERLTEVFQEAAGTPGQKVPVVSIYLKSGQYIQGYLICFSSGPEKKSIVVANYKATEDAAQDLSYIFVDEISGFTVHQADSIVDHLSSGLINLNLKNTPSLNETSEYLQNFVNDLNSRLGAKVSAELIVNSSNPMKAELEALYFCVTDWIRAMRKHSNDEIAQQSLRDHSYQFKFNIGPVAKMDTSKSNEFILFVGKENEKYERISRTTIEACLKEFV
jgi:hypothetical protein